MKRASRLLTAFLLAVLSILFVGSNASANVDHKFDSWEYTIGLNSDGWADVTLDVSADFGTSGAHGPYLVFVRRHTIADDPDHYWTLKYDFKSVTSPSGASAKYEKETENNVVGLKIGNKNRKVFGEQKYRIQYRVYGLINPNNSESGLDEFRFTAFSSEGSNMPVRNLQVRLTSPADTLKSQCDINGSQTNCRTSSTGKETIFSASNLSANQTMTVVSGYPQSTFQAEPYLTKRMNVSNMLTPNAPGLIGGGVILAVGCGLVVNRVRRYGRDKQYLGLTPGLSPVSGAETSIGIRDKKAPVAVQFTPPKDATPGQVGVLIDESADNRDITGMIINLAVMGYMKLERKSKTEWAFIKTPKEPKLRDLSPAEQSVFDRLFSSNNYVTSNDLANEKFHNLVSKTSAKLYDEVVKKKWFDRNPQTVRTLAVMIGAGIIILGGLAGFALGYFFGMGLWGVGAVGVGLAVILCAKAFPARTAEGSAALVQAKGFELFLRTADAKQLQWEEGEDIFSKYLPYAIVFGCAKQWANTFEQLARLGKYTAIPTWYIGDYYLLGGYVGFANALTDSFAVSFSQALSTASAAALKSSVSSGGSGFSGGGGFGGVSGGSW